MKVLLIDPGADWSTKDVMDGATIGLQEAGCEVLAYRFGRRFNLMAKALEAAWREAGRPKSHPSAADAALLASELAVTWAMRQQPDWVVIVSGMFFHPDALRFLRAASYSPECNWNVATLLTESPYDLKHEAAFSEFSDLVWTNERTCVDALRKHCEAAYYLPHGYQPARHGGAHVLSDGSVSVPSSVPGEEPTLVHAVPKHDVVFVGTPFRERVQLLEAIDWTGIDLGLYGTWKLPKRHPLRQFVRAGVTDNRFTTALYKRAKIGLNLFRSNRDGIGPDAEMAAQAESLNPRAYELASAGCFAVTDYRREVDEVFGGLVPTYASADEFSAGIRRWLADDSARQEIAAKLPGAVQNHSWINRGQQMRAAMDRHRGERQRLRAGRQ